MDEVMNECYLSPSGGRVNTFQVEGARSVPQISENDYKHFGLHRRDSHHYQPLKGDRDSRLTPVCGSVNYMYRNLTNSNIFSYST